MTDELRAREQLAVLDEALIVESKLEVPPERREQTLAALTQLVTRRAQRRRRAVTTLGLALAACIALGLGIHSLSVKANDPSVEVTTVAGQRELSEGGVDILFTRAGRAGLAELGGNGSTRLRLFAGAVDIRVPKQRPGESFEVLTPDARVVVHGTRFSVDVTTSPAGSRSCVKVQEGRVSVVRGGRSEQLLPGEVSGCSAAARGTGMLPSASPSSAFTPTPVPSSSAVPSERASSTDATLRPARERRPIQSALADANRLLSRGLELERGGDREAAERAFSQLLQRYPDSAIAPEARSGLERLRRAR